MSVDPEQVVHPSSVKFSLNAKGEGQVEVRVTVGTTQEQIDEARSLAQIAFLASIDWLKERRLRPQ